MQGFIFIELRKYVVVRRGEEAWESLRALAASQGGIYELGKVYPDSEFGAYLRVACEASGLSHEKLLQDFGEFMVPGMLLAYRAFINPDWKTLDLLENTEVSMHAAVRTRDPHSSPPGLHCRRSAPDEVVIEYSSPRRLCPLAKGIIAGIAKHYEEKIELNESQCMHRGDDHCLLSVKLL